MRSNVQSQLYTARKLMHKIVLAFVSNISSRNAMLEYLQKFVQLNTKRTHMTVRKNLHKFLVEYNAEEILSMLNYQSILMIRMTLYQCNHSFRFGELI